MLGTSIVLFVWRLRVPDILDAPSGAGLLYILLVLSLSAMVTVIGWNGASMTFPWKENNRRSSIGDRFWIAEGLGEGGKLHTGCQ